MELSQAIDMFIENLKLKNRSKETYRGYKQVLEEFRKEVEANYNGQVYTDDIALEDLEVYLKFKKDNGYANISVNRAIYIFKSFYNYLTRREIVKRNIAEKLEPLKVKKTTRENLTEEEIEELIAAIDHALVKLAVRTMSKTGLRVSELCQLELEDVDLTKKVIQVIDGKGGKDRTVPINKELEKHLEKYLTEDRPKVNSNRFFATASSGQLSPQYINRILKETTDKLGWKKHVTAHILRHSFASNLIRKDAPLPAVQKLLGHSDLRVTSVYIHQNIDELADAVNLL